VLDIGLGEVVVIVILALLVFGPDRLPKVAADAARTLRQIRQMAVAARKDLSDAAGLKDDPELAQTLRDARDLDPRRALRGLGDDAAPGTAGANGKRPAKPVTDSKTPGSPASAAGGRSAQGGAVPSATAASGEAEAGDPAAGAADPASGNALNPAPADPDWT
jgi:sec-independent protein translocase protein TatB